MNFYLTIGGRSSNGSCGSALCDNPHGIRDPEEVYDRERTAMNYEQAVRSEEA